MSSNWQQGDVLLEQTTDGGETEVLNGLVTMSGGLETAAYLSLFGGNEDDAGGSDTALSWWGNLMETETAPQYRSETQNIIDGLPLSTSNLLRLEKAVGRDLAWLVSEGAASSVSVSASLLSVKSVQITVTIDGDTSLTYVENWNAYR